MLIKDILDLSGVDIHTRRLDHPLQPQFEINKPIFVHRGQITGVQPDLPVRMGLQGLRRLLGHLQIAQHDRRALEADFADFAGRRFFHRSLLHDFDQHVRKDDPYTSLPVFCHRHRHDPRNSLCQAISLAELHSAALPSDDLFKLLFDGAGQLIGTAESPFQATEIGLLKQGIAVEGVKQCGHSHHKSWLFGLDQFGHCFRRELRHQDTLAATHKDGIDAHPQSEAVKNG